MVPHVPTVAAACPADCAATDAQSQSEVREPCEPGGYRGDIWFGDDDDRTLPTHRWTGSEWERVHDR